jgi:protocatechuate 3,4-dioxygenase beta subunit
MRKSVQMVLMFTFVALVACLALVAQGLNRSDTVVAQLPSMTPGELTLTPLTPPANTNTPTPSNTPINTPTNTPTSTPTNTATNTPVNTPTPTNTPTNTPVNTSTPTNTPINTLTPTRTTAPGQPSPTSEKTKAPEPPSKPNPNCQSVVEGYVIDSSGRRAPGATVYIEGEGFSNAMMTDDNGHYGFGGLCAGTVTLTAHLPDGQTSQTAQASLDGKNSAQLDLSVRPAGAIITTPASTLQHTPTPEPDMPATGYSGWLLVGAALLGALLLISAGARRALTVRERTRDGD